MWPRTSKCVNWWLQINLLVLSTEDACRHVSSQSKNKLSSPPTKKSCISLWPRKNKGHFFKIIYVIRLDQGHSTHFEHSLLAHADSYGSLFWEQPHCWYYQKFSFQDVQTGLLWILFNIPEKCPWSNRVDKQCPKVSDVTISHILMEHASNCSSSRDCEVVNHLIAHFILNITYETIQWQQKLKTCQFLIFRANLSMFSFFFLLLYFSF